MAAAVAGRAPEVPPAQAHIGLVAADLYLLMHGHRVAGMGAGCAALLHMDVLNVADVPWCGVRQGRACTCSPSNRARPPGPCRITIVAFLPQWQMVRT